jgi:Flp pilus assembly protein TadG
MRSIMTFLGDDSGSETIQFVVWLPLFAFLLVIVTDASYLFLYHTEMENVARDTARRMTTGDITSQADAETHAYAQLFESNQPYEVTANYDPDSAMTVIISVPMVDVTVFGFFVRPVLGQTMNARVVMRSEPS